MDVSPENAAILVIIAAVLITAGYAWQTRAALAAHKWMLAVFGTGCAVIIGLAGLFQQRLVPQGIVVSRTAVVVTVLGIALGLFLGRRHIITNAKRLLETFREGGGYRATKESKRRAKMAKQYESLLDLLRDPEFDDPQYLRMKSKTVATLLTGIPDEDFEPLAQHLCLREFGSDARTRELTEFLRGERNLIAEAHGFGSRHFERLRKKLESLAEAA